MDWIISELESIELADKVNEQCYARQDIQDWQ
jgi:hypothetical protein